MQDKLGRFIKGTHWRPWRPFWDKEWLENEYVTKKKSASEIAKTFNVRDTAIYFWLRKHGIKTRTISETRKVKYWGLLGKKNGMYGKIGELNPRWNGGHSPERQSKYARAAWKELAKCILRRDSFHCRKCGVANRVGNKLVVHHKRQWSKYPEYRFVVSNLITVCEKCHKEIHKKKPEGWLIP